MDHNRLTERGLQLYKATLYLHCQIPGLNTDISIPLKFKLCDGSERIMLTLMLCAEGSEKEKWLIMRTAFSESVLTHDCLGGSFK